MKIFLIALISAALLTLPSAGMITDEFAENSLSKDLKIREYKPPVIKDDFAQANKNKSENRQKVVITEVLPEIKYKKVIRKFNILEDGGIPVTIKLKNKLTTKTKPQEGSEIEFVTLEEIKHQGHIYPAGTVVKARIETVSMNSSWGVPADIVIGNFTINNTPLYGEISKIGADRSHWLRPLAFAGCMFFGAGYFLFFIRGGHAKIKPDETFTVYF